MRRGEQGEKGDDVPPELVEVEALARRVLGEVREVVEALGGEPRAGSAERMRRTFTDLARRDRRRRRATALFLVAAAAGILLFLGPWRRERDGSSATPTTQWLGDRATFALHLDGGLWHAQWKPFRAGERGELTFYVDANGTPGAVLLGPLEVLSETWVATEAQMSLLGEGFLAELVRLDAAGELDEIVQVQGRRER